MKLRLLGKRKEALNTWSFVLEPPEDFSWKPGQFLHYTLEHENPDDRGDDRYFTIASAPHEGYIMITTRKAEKPSSFKSALFDMDKDDVIEAEGPDGDFIIEDYDKDHVLIAGGVGVTPFRAILLDCDYHEKPINMTLLYGNGSQDFVYEEELEELENKYDNLDIKYFVEPERIGVEEIKEMEDNLEDPIYWVSGPEPMVEAIGEMIVKEVGIDEDRVEHDYFPGYEWSW